MEAAELCAQCQEQLLVPCVWVWQHGRCGRDPGHRHHVGHLRERALARVQDSGPARYCGMGRVS